MNGFEEMLNDIFNSEKLSTISMMPSEVTMASSSGNMEGYTTSTSSGINLPASSTGDLGWSNVSVPPYTTLTIHDAMACQEKDNDDECDYFDIVDVFFQDQKTTILWADGTHTTVGYYQEDGTSYSRLDGLAMCLLKRYFEKMTVGNESYREAMKSIVPNVFFDPEEAKKLIAEYYQAGKITAKQQKTLLKRLSKMEKEFCTSVLRGKSPNKALKYVVDCFVEKISNRSKSA